MIFVAIIQCEHRERWKHSGWVRCHRRVQAEYARARVAADLANEQARREGWQVSDGRSFTADLCPQHRAIAEQRKKEKDGVRNRIE